MHGINIACSISKIIHVMLHYWKLQHVGHIWIVLWVSGLTGAMHPHSTLHFIASYAENDHSQCAVLTTFTANKNSIILTIIIS